MTNPPKTPPLWIYSAVRAPDKPPSKKEKAAFEFSSHRITTNPKRNKQSAAKIT